MRLDLVVTESVKINAPASKVWHALTSHDIIKTYLFGTDTRTDWRVGSEIIFKGEYQGKEYNDHGLILENIFEEKLSYSYWSGFSGLEDLPENYSIVTYILQSSRNGTELTWEQKGFSDIDNQAHTATSVRNILQQIKEIVEH